MSETGLPEPIPDRPEDPIVASFWGTASLVFSAGQSQLLVDGFFSRPSRACVLFGKIGPNPDLIGTSLAQAGIDQLAAILVSHAHYDHALDAPEIARQTAALLVGSQSIANIGKGWGLSAEQLIIPMPGLPFSVGSFTVTYIPSCHSRPNIFPGVIRQPFQPPVSASRYREGGASTILIQAARQSILVQASAGFIPGALAGIRASSVFLSVASLWRAGKAFRKKYYEETIMAVEAKTVYPIHWDDFTQPSSKPLRMLPAWLDSIQATLAEISSLCAVHNIQFIIPAYRTPFVLAD